MTYDHNFKINKERQKRTIREACKFREKFSDSFFDNFEFILEPSEKHQRGWHSHLGILRRGEYRRTGHLLTLQEGIIYLVEHKFPYLINHYEYATRLKVELWDSVGDLVVKGRNYFQLTEEDLNRAVALFRVE
jgi:hypothetical protein